MGLPPSSEGKVHCSLTSVPSLNVTVAGDILVGTDAAIKDKLADHGDQPCMFLALYLERYVSPTCIESVTVSVRARESTELPMRSVHIVPSEASSYYKA